MHDLAPKSDDTDPLIRSVLTMTTRSALIFCAAFMISWFIFLLCGIVYFEFMLE